MTSRRALPALALASYFVAGCTNAPAASTPDASTPSHCARDADCDDGRFCNGVEVCAPDASSADARGCALGAAPCAASSCNESTDTCGTGCADADRDGHTAVSCGGDDCDDADANRYTGNTEVCDPMDHDEDCDPRTFGVRDQDHDGEADALCCNVSPTGTRTCGTDCDDTRSTVNTTAPEVCNRIDDDCDMAIDEGVGTTYARDADHDTHGDPMDVMMLCGPMGEYTATLADDCDDADPIVYPGAREICDGRDDDCSSGGGADSAEDADGDMHTASSYTGCEATPSSFQRDDCNDGNPLIHPGADYQDVPFGCVPGETCISTRTNTWTCGHRVAGGVACAVELADGTGGPSWDYDCSGAAEREPLGAVGLQAQCNFLCASGFGTTCEACAMTTFGGCAMPVGAGAPFLAVQGACGMPATFRRCSGAACGACPNTDTIGRQPCR
jgi:hypothetical protein